MGWRDHERFHRDVDDLKNELKLVDIQAKAVIKKQNCRCINAGRSVCRCA
jgi:hypothetical protein